MGSGRRHVEVDSPQAEARRQVKKEKKQRQVWVFTGLWSLPIVTPDKGVVCFLRETRSAATPLQLLHTAQMQPSQSSQQVREEL
jgi:hypothetical protein